MKGRGRGKQTEREEREMHQNANSDCCWKMELKVIFVSVFFMVYYIFHTIINTSYICNVKQFLRKKIE